MRFFICVITHWLTVTLQRPRSLVYKDSDQLELHQKNNNKDLSKEFAFKRLTPNADEGNICISV